MAGVAAEIRTSHLYDKRQIQREVTVRVRLVLR